MKNFQSTRTDEKLKQNQMKEILRRISLTKTGRNVRKYENVIKRQIVTLKLYDERKISRKNKCANKNY